MYIFLNENNCGYGSDQGSLILFEVRKRVTEEKEINKKTTTTKTLAAYQILMNTYGECVCECVFMFECEHAQASFR